MEPIPASSLPREVALQDDIDEDGVAIDPSTAAVCTNRPSSLPSLHEGSDREELEYGIEPVDATVASHGVETLTSSPKQPERAVLRPPNTFLDDLHRRVAQLQESQKSNSLIARYFMSNSVETSKVAPSHPRQSSMPISSAEKTTRHSEETLLRYPNTRIYRRKLVLLGYQEVGKTSLRKCFESEPFFFFLRDLPDVRATTGLEVQQKQLLVQGEPLQFLLSDFAGQESYHSHTHFLTERSIFALVWKISSIEQDFQSSGISANEEERLYKWIAEVYAKFPASKLVLMATHLDELRVQGQRSVEMILSKVEERVNDFLERTAIVDGHSRRKLMCQIVGNFAVSCKSRTFIASGGLRGLSGGKVSKLLMYLAEVARRDCQKDPEYPAAAILGRHLRLMEEVEHIKKSFPGKLLMPTDEFVERAARAGVETDGELLQVAKLMHSWDIIYLFSARRIEDNRFIMLQPRWLSRIAAIPFSYGHILRTPRHLRSLIGGLEYTVSRAEMADMSLMCKGYLRWPLARIIFHRPLVDALNREPEDSDVAMCLHLLEAMDILRPVEMTCDEPRIVAEETPCESGPDQALIATERITRYFIPSLSPYCVPHIFQRILPLLFHRGIRIKFEFNLLPDELWWRLQAKLQPFEQFITVHQPHCPMDWDGMQEDEELMEDYRLREADDEHSRWKDGMWLKGDACRVMLSRKGLKAIHVYSLETTPQSASKVMESLEDALATLLVEYRGVHRRMWAACPGVTCEGWLDANAVATSASVTCPTCRESFSSDVVASPKTSILEKTNCADEVLIETCELLRDSLSPNTCVSLCQYLGIPFVSASPATSDGREETKVSEVVHIEYLHAIDRVLQAAMFRSWRARIDEQAKRRRMLELEPSPSYL